MKYKNTSFMRKYYAVFAKPYHIYPDSKEIQCTFLIKKPKLLSYPKIYLEYFRILMESESNSDEDKIEVTLQKSKSNADTFKENNGKINS